MPPLAISPVRVVVNPGGKQTFVASDGTGPYTFAFVTGGNRSGGTIDSGTGAYVAGPRGPVEDLVKVTDNVAAVAQAEISVTGTMYREYQSLLPQGPQGVRKVAIEQTLGGEKDIQLERTRQAVIAPLPGIGTPSALDVLGQDRMIPRAYYEEPPDNGGANDVLYAAVLRTIFSANTGWKPAGGHERMLRALERAQFPMGTPTGLHIVQRIVRYTWLHNVTTAFNKGTHPVWTFDEKPPRIWHQFGIVIGQDFVPPIGTLLQDGDPSAQLLNRIVRMFQPAKATYMGAWVVVSEPVWGWPIGAQWGGARTWGGGVTRFVSPT